MFKPTSSFTRLTGSGLDQFPRPVPSRRSDCARIMGYEPTVNILSLTNINTRGHQALDSINVEHRFSSTGRSQPLADSYKRIERNGGFDRSENTFPLPETFYSPRKSASRVR